MNVFLVGAPHQLFNAIEARQQLQLGSNHLVVSLSGVYPASAFEPMLREYEWEHVEYARGESVLRSDERGRRQQFVQVLATLRDNYHQRRQLDAMARKLAGPERLILGNYGMYYMRHFANRIGGRDLILLDDGTATLGINQERRVLRGEEDGPELKVTRRQKLRKWMGFDTRHVPKVTFFTTYDLRLAEGDSLIRNEYTYFRGRAAMNEAGDEVFFVGQPMVEDGLVAMERLVASLREVKAHFRDERFVYLPHKREQPDKVRALQEALGVEVRRFDVPLEFQMSVRGTRPKVLASFFSSALENSRVIFGSLMRIKSFRMRPEDFAMRREEIASIYEYYAGKQSEHFEVVG
jgi:hypothetical protein